MFLLPRLARASSASSSSSSSSEASKRPTRVAWTGRKEPPDHQKRRRQGKFQPFRRLFGKKKKREAKGGFDGAQLKASFSTGEVCNGVVSDEEELNQSLRELNPIGSRALSHDSIFIPEESVQEDGPDHVTMSQENVSDKVKNLQKQIAQTIKFGQKPPSLRRSEGDEGSSDEEEEVPRSPLRVMAQVETEPAKAEPMQVTPPARQHSTPVKSPRSKRVLPPSGTIESVNLDAVPHSVPLLDNTAAKHRLSVKPKNQRVSRKHRRFTQDLQDESIPGLVEEELEAAGVSADHQRRSSVEESIEILKKHKVMDEERLQAKRRRELEDEERRKRAEQLRLEEERRRKHQQQEEEELKRLQEEAQRRREEEERRMRKEEERRQQEEEELRRLQEESQRRREEEERRMRKEEERRQREEEEVRRLQDEKRWKEEEERKRRQEEEEARRQKEMEVERVRLEKLRDEKEKMKKKKEAEKKRLRDIEEKQKEEQKRMAEEDFDGFSDPQEKKRRAEELRWREMEERQRPFSFQVSSGEKEILFQKVNLTPVTSAASTHVGTGGDLNEGSKTSIALDSPIRQSSPYVPHTAILVTGAQLCGTAVNLDQIKDTACKSLLGLGEDRKAQGTPPPTKSKMSPERKSGKTKSLTESTLFTDLSGAGVLAEWATIRSKIFKGVEEDKCEEYPEPSRNQHEVSHEDEHEFAHTHLRKTMSASAKFSITPAKKKFGDSNRSSECFSADDKVTGEEPMSSDASASDSPATSRKPQNRMSKTVRISERGSEECVFAKDLPSFLVPSPGTKPECLESRGRDGSVSAESESRMEDDGQSLDSEDKPSPFGIKLRRTNYSLRFHSEQSMEKRKKRYSAGDSFDGVPSPLTPMEPDSDASPVFSDKTSPASPQTEGGLGKYLLASASPVMPRAGSGKTPGPTPHCEDDGVPSKQSLYRRLPTSPKPTDGVPTPPPSPLPKVALSAAGVELANQNQTSAVAQLQRSGQSQMQGEEEPKEKRSFFPSINIPWREKTDRKTELIKRDKPSLQSRHSLDSAKLQEKEAGPLWITLALQKQKGFREQQQNRDERRSQREAKLAEKQSRESAVLSSPTDSKGSGSGSPGSKAQTPEESKRPDSLLGRFERREQLKKANTLPSSVTVEIADATPSPPAVKDVSKRFPSMDSPQVSTEPAWLALAKRKAKAWSDCPQIIK
ncbi:capping protein inhibiting regulator of actin dynamics isoform X2 [Nerophis ophidion]|uniref:capping protein inhibiting regulator of actin dynamics isoform X2 n=1 Tax=Nerophis ophidion TaxID=159077 RepID=UPI002AE00F86|nr:capping protein inhibiting regulator of actin dynamics isoform X2 [Nerophis ophidion]